MKIEKLLYIAGDLPLQTFDWGKRVVEIINFVADNRHKVSVRLTGQEAKAVTDSLTTDLKEKLDRLRLNIETGEVNEIQPAIVKVKSDLSKLDSNKDSNQTIVPLNMANNRVINQQVIAREIIPKWSLVTGLFITLFSLLLVILISTSSTLKNNENEKNAASGLLRIFSDFTSFFIRSNSSSNSSYGNGQYYQNNRGYNDPYGNYSNPGYLNPPPYMDNPSNNTPESSTGDSSVNNGIIVNPPEE